MSITLAEAATEMPVRERIAELGQRVLDGGEISRDEALELARIESNADITDLLAVIERWGDQCDGEEDCTADQDGDGTIGIGDLLIVLDNWS